MSFKKSFILALSNIMFDKMRSLLTMLGIIIGVAAVIILISLMNGMTGMMNDQFAELGTTTITVSVQDRGGSRTLDDDDFYAFVDENSDVISGVTPMVNVAGAKVKEGGNDITTSLNGVNEQSEEINQLNVTAGRFLQYNDMKRKSKVCVVGTYIQKEFFGTESALNQQIKINGRTFEIIGILEEKDDSNSGGSDEVIYIPYTTAIVMGSSKFINAYTVAASSDEQVDAAKQRLTEMLDKKIGDSDYYSVSALADLLDMMNEMTGTMKTLLVCIAGISLLVGGIGIMNIMLVSVTERTREIGIRKSLGAKGKDIKSQFVIEAGTISGVGGIIGIVVGAVAAISFGKLLGLDAVPSLGAIGVSFGVSVGIGILFGYLPAKNAAKLNPIEALRHD